MVYRQVDGHLQGAGLGGLAFRVAIGERPTGYKYSLPWTLDMYIPYHL